MRIFKIALTGAPCSGKSSSLACLKKSLEEHGLKVFTVPEVATLLFDNGAELRNISEEKLFTLQSAMLNLMIALEDSIEDIAKSSEKDYVLLCDRGALDMSAFVSKKLWAKILDNNRLTSSQLCSRYDAVIHLMSAANGAEEFYTTENNKARAETPEQAREIDEKLKNAWVGHPHLRIVEACSDFSDKKRKVLNCVYRVVGIPEPVEIERKYLLSDVGDIPVKYVDSFITQTYLSDKSRVRSRSFDGLVQRTHTIKKEIEPGKRTEIERIISGEEYLELLEQADPDRIPIKKVRRCFLWENQYFELDLYVNLLDPVTNNPLEVMELEVDSLEEKVILPPFVEVIDEITFSPLYSNRELAKKRQ